MEVKLIRKHRVHTSLELALMGIFSSLSIVLSWIEWLLPPFPMLPPGVKPGFSNVAIMYIANEIGVFPALLLSLIKSIFVFFTRGVSAFLMSLFAGLMSTVITGILMRIHNGKFSMIGIGILGSCTHELIQFAVFSILIESIVWSYLPILLFFSLFTGAATGSTLHIVFPVFRRVSMHYLSF